MNIEQIEKITPLPLPFDLDAKIFRSCDCEEDCSCERSSLNDELQRIKDIAGVSEELMGEK